MTPKVVKTFFYCGYICWWDDGGNSSGVVAHHEKEWGCVASLCHVLVVSELHVGDIVNLFVESVSVVNPKVCFDNLIHSFGSSIGLWVVSCAHERLEVAESG